MKEENQDAKNERKFQDKLKEELRDTKKGVASIPAPVRDEAADISPGAFEMLHAVHDVRLQTFAYDGDENLLKALHQGVGYAFTQDRRVVGVGKFMGRNRVIGEYIFVMDEEVEPGEYVLILNSRQEFTLSIKDDGLYVVQDSRGYVGNAMSFWGHNGSGYTTNFNKAGKFTKEKALAIHNAHKDRTHIWPVKYMQQRLIQIIDSQYVSKCETRDDIGWRECAKNLMYDIAYNTKPKKADVHPDKYPSDWISDVAIAAKMFFNQNRQLNISISIRRLSALVNDHGSMHFNDASELPALPGYDEFNKILAKWHMHVQSLNFDS